MLTGIAILSLLLAAACAAVIVLDMTLRGYRQPMTVMAVVWPVTALYLGPIGLWAYARWGRPRSPRWRREHGRPAERAMATSVGVAVGHCGAGCTLGDIVGASLVFVVGIRLFGLALWAELVLDFAFAFVLGIGFQYLTIAPMRGLGVADGLRAAVRADALSLIAFEVGLFAWMIALRFVVFATDPLHPDQPMYWAAMQLGMVLGFVTSFPANWWLVSHGYKERM